MSGSLFEGRRFRPVNTASWSFAKIRRGPGNHYQKDWRPNLVLHLLSGKATDEEISNFVDLLFAPAKQVNEQVTAESNAAEKTDSAINKEEREG